MNHQVGSIKSHPQNWKGPNLRHGAWPHDCLSLDPSDFNLLLGKREKVYVSKAITNHPFLDVLFLHP